MKGMRFSAMYLAPHFHKHPETQLRPTSLYSFKRASLSLTAFLIFCFKAVKPFAAVAFILDFLLPPAEVEVEASVSSRFRMTRRNTGGRSDDVEPGRGAANLASLSNSRNNYTIYIVSVKYMERA